MREKPAESVIGLTDLSQIRFPKCCLGRHPGKCPDSREVKLEKGNKKDGDRAHRLDIIPKDVDSLLHEKGVRTPNDAQQIWH